MLMAKIVALIPARAGSKGVPDKNVRSLGGHFLIDWTIAACKKSKSIDRIILSTDSPEYARLGKKFGAEVPFLRPEEISGDYSTDYEFIIHALDWLAAQAEEPDYIVHMRPTTPFREPSLIDDAINAFLNAPQATALRSVQEMSESAYKTFEISPDGQLKMVGGSGTAIDAANYARQSFPKTYMANGYIDVLSTKFIRESGLLHGDNVIPFMTPAIVEVDTEDDFRNLEYLLVCSPDITMNVFN